MSSDANIADVGDITVKGDCVEQRCWASETRSIDIRVSNYVGESYA